MKNRGRYLLSAVVFSLGLLLLSCSGNDGDGAAGGEKAASGDVSGSISVRIIPEEPTVDGSLTAVVSGEADEVAFLWEAGGRVVGESDRIDAAALQKGQEVKVTVSAGALQSTTKIVISNAPPEVEKVNLSPGTIYRGVDLSVEVSGFDPDEDFVSYSYQWFLNGEELHMETGSVLRGDLYNRGDRITLKVTPSDAELQGRAFVSKPILVENAPPRFTSVPPDKFESRVYSYRAVAEDPDGDKVTFSLLKAPEGMTIDGNGLITWAIEKGNGGSHAVEIAAEDQVGGKDTQSYEFDITIP